MFYHTHITRDEGWKALYCLTTLQLLERKLADLNSVPLVHKGCRY